jgi:hypothetical protein
MRKTNPILEREMMHNVLHFKNLQVCTSKSKIVPTLGDMFDGSYSAESCTKSKNIE